MQFFSQRISFHKAILSYQQQISLSHGPSFLKNLVLSWAILMGQLYPKGHLFGQYFLLRGTSFTRRANHMRQLLGQLFPSIILIFNEVYQLAFPLGQGPTAGAICYSKVDTKNPPGKSSYCNS